jgi:biopolymer transport protein TolQ
MFGFLFNSAAWQLIAQSDFMTHLVLLILFAASILCVAIIIFKMMFFKREARAFTYLMQKIKAARSIQDITQIRREFKNTFAGNFVDDALSQLNSVLKHAQEREAQLPLSGDSLTNFEIELEHLVDEYLIKAEEYLPVLGTSAAASPLAGLFGTIWGLIHSFINISQEKSADIAIVAPGIAEALMTTLAGLIVAIPALVFYHYFAHEVRKFEQHFTIISEKIFSCAKNPRSSISEMELNVAPQRIAA